MTLEAFIKEHPQAHDEIIGYARPYLAEETTAQIQAESKRITAILALSGISLTDMVRNAITSGTGPGDFAIQEVERFRSQAGNQNAQSLHLPRINQEIKDQISPDTKPSAETATEESVRALARERR